MLRSETLQGFLSCFHQCEYKAAIKFWTETYNYKPIAIKMLEACQKRAENCIKQRNCTTCTMSTYCQNGNKITVVLNRLGNAHVFQGKQTENLDFSNSCNIKYKDGKESDVYLQVDSDVLALKKFMTTEQQKDFDNGYAIVLEDMGYFC